LGGAKPLAIDSAGSMTASQAKLKPVTGYPPRTFDGGMRLQFWPQANLAQMGNIVAGVVMWTLSSKQYFRRRGHHSGRWTAHQ
jgi:hypothetical protein